MIRLLAGAFALSLLCAAVAPAQDAGSPHRMTKADGALDMDTCGMCHNEDMSLQRSKVETCTLCHSPTVHAGAQEHLRATPFDVKQALKGQPEGAPALPLGDEGRMYCGTCHYFHDPKVMEEQWLAHGWVPPDSGIAGAVRKGVTDRWAALAAKSDDQAALGQFAAKGTRQLRLPVDDGQLCRQCHGALR